MTKKRNNKKQDTINLSAYERLSYRKMFYSTMKWLEKYIEKAGYYDDWENRKQIRGGEIKRMDISSPKEFERYLSTAFFGLDLGGDEKTLLREELKEEFYRWIDRSGINVSNCPKRLAFFLFGTHEILEGRDEKIMEDGMNRIQVLDADSPEYLEAMQKTFANVQGPRREEAERERSLTGKNYNDISVDSEFKGDAKRGKEIFDLIASSVIADYQYFHFFPQKNQQTRNPNYNPLTDDPSEEFSSSSSPASLNMNIIRSIKQNPQNWRLDEIATEIGYFSVEKKWEWLLIHWDAREKDFDNEGKLNFDNNPLYRWQSFNAHQRFEIKVALNVSSNYLTEEEIKWVVEEAKNNPSIWRIETYKGHNCLIHGLAQGNNDNEIGTLIHSQQKFSDLEWKEINKAIIIQNISQWEFRDVIVFNGIFNDRMKLTKYDNERGEKVFIKKSVQLGPNDYDNLGNLLPQLGKIYREPDFNKEQWAEIKNAYDKMNPNYDNWTREQFIAEINRLKAENEQLRNNQNLTSSERQERLQRNQQRIDELVSYVNVGSHPNNSDSSFPVGWIVGGGLLTAVGLAILLIVKSKKKRKISH